MEATIREAYGQALVECGKEDSNIVVLDADVSSSTKSCLFGQAFPDRFFNVGVAEANMNAMACGFASCSKIPFTNTFATFQTSNGLLSLRALASYNSLNVKVMGGYGGLSDSYDGPTHHAMDDLAIMSALPNFTVAVASDATLTAYLVQEAARRNGPFYVRLSREALPKLYEASTPFELGKAKTISTGEDATVIACGVMVSKALAAASMTSASVGVIDMFTIKPLDKATVIRAAQKTGAIVVAEEHNCRGGLGEKVAAALAEANVHVPISFVALKDVHTESGSYEALLSKYGLDETAILRAIEEVLRKKQGNGSIQ